jgi:transposase-like protein
MGQPVVHWEFWSEDPSGIAEFYRTVFGWSIRPLPALDYQLVEPRRSQRNRWRHHEAEIRPLARQGYPVH